MFHYITNNAQGKEWVELFERKIMRKIVDKEYLPYYNRCEIAAENHQ